VPVGIREVPAEHEAICRFERVLQSSAERPSRLSASAHTLCVLKRNSYPSRDTAKVLREVGDMMNPISILGQEIEFVARIALVNLDQWGGSNQV
jgi:hypothetical protein